MNYFLLIFDDFDLELSEEYSEVHHNCCFLMVSEFSDTILCESDNIGYLNKHFSKARLSYWGRFVILYLYAAVKWSHNWICIVSHNLPSIKYLRIYKLCVCTRTVSWSNQWVLLIFTRTLSLPSDDKPSKFSPMLLLFRNRHNQMLLITIYINRMNLIT